MSMWCGDLAPSGWFGRLKGRSLGAFVAGRLEAMISIRYEIDSSSLLKAVQGKHVMIVDGIVLALSIRDESHTLFHAALMQTLVSLGEYHSMNVLFWSDFGI